MRHSPGFARAGLIAALAALTMAGCANSPMASSGGMGMGGMGYRAALSGAAEVPPTDSAGSGTLDASFDKATSTLKWRVTYQGLTGPATMAHFHGPAMPGANAGVVVPFASPASPIEGQAVLTPAQAADLMAGRWYVNVHTQRFPGGEIRGQVMAK